MTEKIIVYMIQLTVWINMSHFNLISLVVKLEVLNIDWGLVFIIYSKYPRTRLIWLIKSIIAPRGGLSTPGISICSTQNWGAGHFISDPKHCNDGPLRGLSARIGSWPNNLSLPASGEYFPLPLLPLDPMFRDAACDRIWSGLTWFTLPSFCQLFVWDFHQNEEISKRKKRVKTIRFSLI